MIQSVFSIKLVNTYVNVKSDKLTMFIMLANVIHIDVTCFEIQDMQKPMPYEALTGEDIF